MVAPSVRALSYIPPILCCKRPRGDRLETRIPKGTRQQRLPPPPPLRRAIGAFRPSFGNVHVRARRKPPAMAAFVVVPMR